MIDKAKIGLLTGGFFEYWRMYPDLEKIVEEEMRQVVKGLEKTGLDLVWSGLADTQEKTEEAGRKFHEEDIDLLVICEGTYFPDYYPIKTMDYLPGVPVLILLTQPRDHVPKDLNYEDAVHHSFGLVGVVQLTGAFRKMGKSFELLVGSLDDETMYRKAADYARVVMVRKKLRFLNLGIIGHTFQGMYDLELDKTKLKAKIGANVNYIEVGELLREWKKIKDSDVGALADKVTGSYQVDGTGREDIENACRLGLAMEKIAEVHNLDGMSHLCQHLLHVETGTTPCFAVSHLVERGIMVTCEGDIGNIISMCILHYLTGSEAVFLEWGMFDVRENAMLMVHHGGASPRMALKPSEASLTPTGEKWGFKGKGASFRFVGKPGYVTILSLINDRDGWKMLISGGEALDVPVRPYYGQQFMVKMDRPIKEYLEALCREGVTHHAALVYGDVREDLDKLADLLDVKKVRL